MRWWSMWWIQSYLFVIETRSQGEHARLRVEGEDVVAPVGEDRVRDLGVDAFVQVADADGADESAAPRVFGDVERVGRFRERRRVVVRVRYLPQSQYKFRCNLIEFIQVESRLSEFKLN